MLLKHDPDNAKARESAAAHAVSEVGKARQAEAFDAGRHIFDGIHIASPWVQLEQSATEDSLQRVIRRFTAERRCREAQPLEKRREIDSLLERIATIRFFGAENREGSDLLELFALEAMRMDRALLATPEMGKTLVQMMEHNLQAWSVGIKTHQGADALTEGTFEKLLVIGSILCSQGGEHSTNLDDFCCRNDKNLVKLLRKGTKSGFPGSEIATFDEIFIKKTIAPENVLQDFSCGILRYLEIECEDPAYIAFELPLFFELLPEQLYDSVIRAPQVVKAYTDWIGAAKLVCTELVELIRKSSEEERPVYEKSLLEYLHAMSVVMNWVGGVKEFDISGFFDDERGDLIGIEFLNPEGSSDPSESASTNISSLSGQEQSFDGVSVRLVPSETELPEVGSSHNDPLTVGEISARRLSQIEGFFNCIRDELRFSSDLVISPESDILKRVGEIYTKLCSEEL